MVSDEYVTTAFGSRMLLDQHTAHRHTPDVGGRWALRKREDEVCVGDMDGISTLNSDGRFDLLFARFE